MASTSQQSAKAAARTWAAPLAFDDAYELMNHPEVDLVTIAVQLPLRDGLTAATRVHQSLDAIGRAASTGKRESVG